MAKPIVWTIAGSDCGGGAGIQADIQGISGLGGYACSIITAITAQNSQGVEAINPVSEAVLLSQLDSLADDMPATVIKIGLLANQAQVRLVAAKIAEYKDLWPQQPIVIYDPVAIASTGQRLTEQDITATVIAQLFPLVDILTPNSREVQLLTGIYLLGAEAVQQAGHKIMTMGVGAVIIKGGHWNYPAGYCVDYCVTQIGVTSQHYWLASKTINTPHNHGSGCSFSAALATVLALGHPLKDAFVVAKAYINQGLAAAQRVGEGIGPVAHEGWPQQLVDYPQVVEAGSPLADELDLNDNNARPLICGFAECPKNLGLYPVVDSVSLLTKLLALGVRTLQLRIKDLTGEALEQAVSTAIALAKPYQAQLFINDHWQLAIKYAAYGVHLGQEDLNNANLAEIKWAGLRLGLSTHGYYEMIRAYAYRPSYLAFGAIYPTKTKEMTGQIQGLSRLAKFVQLFSGHPTVAIGGIDLARAPAVAATGVGSIAVVSALTEATDLAGTVSAFSQLLAVDG